MSKLKVDTITNVSGGVVNLPGFESGGGSGDVSGSGADAWGLVASNGTLLGGLNCTVSKSGNTYTITFITPMPNEFYSVVASSGESGGNHGVGSYLKTATGFKVQIRNDSNTLTNKQFSFAVFATNALPPKGGTGTDAWATVDLTTANGACNVPASFNVDSVTRTAVGRYDVLFTTPMPTANYSVVATPVWDGSGNFPSSATQNLTTTGFTIINFSSSAADLPFSFTVNATNATLPQTVTQEQIDAAINNPGASAWARTAADGTLLNGMNFASVVKNGVFYDYVFSTPMPDANYSIVGMVEDNASIRSLNVTANGFQINMNNANATGSIAKVHSIAVFATNALPPKGCTGTDAWGSVDETSVNGPCNVPASFNVASVTRTTTGTYDVVFTTPMPTVNYCVNATVTKYTYGAARPVNKTVNGFTVNTVFNANGSVALSDYPFDFTVNATNATLPQTVTTEQIDAAINNPGASAWGVVADDGTLEGGLNVSSVTKTGGGIYDVVFTTPMPDANYSVSGLVDNPGSYGTIITTNKTPTGFTAKTGYNNTANIAFNYAFSFAVFATNALPPKGGTGTDSWATVDKRTVNGACNVPASFNVASVTRTGLGKYDVVFTTPMPTDNYALQLTADFGNTRQYVINYEDVTATGFSVFSSSLSTFEDVAFSFTVNATNATLPTTFTEAQIQSVIDAQPQGIAKAWVNFDGSGTVAIRDSLNVNSITDNGTGDYRINFTTSMSNSNYSVVVASNQEDTNVRQIGVCNDYTATGFRVTLEDATGSFGSSRQDSDITTAVVFSS